MSTKMKKEYDTPLVELFESRIEKGFDGSNTNVPEDPEGLQQVTDSGRQYGNTLFT